MTLTYDVATDRGKVRLFIQDTVEANEFYDDTEIDAFLTLAADLDGAAIYNASALALESWASNQLMVLKVIERLDLKTDGAKMAAEMRLRAQGLREQAMAASDDAGFEIAEMALGPWSVREQIVNEAIEDV